jgi:hypothetical protein
MVVQVTGKTTLSASLPKLLDEAARTVELPPRFTAAEEALQLSPSEVLGVAHVLSSAVRGASLRPALTLGRLGEHVAGYLRVRASEIQRFDRQPERERQDQDREQPPEQIRPASSMVRRRSG